VPGGAAAGAARRVRKEADSAREERRADASKGRDNPTGDLAKEQQEIARAARDLAGAVAKEQGEKAGSTEKAQKAGEAAAAGGAGVQRGGLEKAQESGKAAAEGMRELAGELAKTPRGAGEDTAEKARSLLRRQESVNRKLAPLAGSTAAERAA